MQDKALGWLRNGVTVVLALAFVAGVFLPVYTDEVGWRFQERAAIDGVDKLFSDVCGLNTLAPPPLFMMPVRHFSATFNLWFADPFYVRLSGIFYALLWLAMLLALARRIAANRREQAVLGLCAAGLMALANMPLLLVWSRPEQPLLLTLTAALLLAFAGSRRGEPEETPRGKAWMRSLAILALATIALSYHLKGLLLVPAFLACLWFSARGRAARVPRIAAGGLTLAHAAIAASYWVRRLQCPDDPVLRSFYARQNFGADLSRIDGPAAALELVGKLIANIDLWSYVALSLPSNRPMSDWLPRGHVGELASTGWGILVFTCWAAVAGIALLCLFDRLRHGFARRRVDRRVVLSLLLLGTAIAWSATQGDRNVYETTFVLPLLMLSFVFALAARPLPESQARPRDAMVAVLGLAAIASVILTGLLWREPLARSNAQAGYIAEQPYSLTTFGYARLKGDILGAARKCGIPRPDQARALLIDDLTYFPFMESRLPQHRLGVLGMWRGSIRDPIAYLKGRGSDGIILGCHMLPPELRRRARSQGGFCCLGGSNW